MSSFFFLTLKDVIMDNTKSSVPSSILDLTMTSENLLEKHKGLRYNDKKLKWSLVPQSAFEPMVKVLEFGAIKYDAHNWKKGLKFTEICESLKRHLDAFMEGEDLDPESGISHIGHIQCNSLFLGWMQKNRPDMDDRYIFEPPKLK